MQFTTRLLADVAQPNAVNDTVFVVMLFACLAAPFLFGFLILAVAHIHRKRAQRHSQNRL